MTSQRLPLLMLVALFVAACGPRTTAAGTAAPAPAEVTSLAPGDSSPWLSAASCAPCHERETREWRASRHASAATNELFVASFGLSSPSWCLTCHAPLPEQRRELLLREPGAGLLSEGIGCAPCHLRDGSILSARAPTSAGLEAHPMRHEPELTTSRFCARCHQFDSPDLPELTPGGLTSLQDTFAEWSRSGAAEPCQGCHMAAGAGHRMPGAHDRKLVRDTVSVVISMPEPGVVTASLRSRGAGHAVPTGDPFRRFRIRLCADDGCLHPLVTWWAIRRFEREEGVVVHGEDSRIPVPGPDGVGERSFRFVSDAPLPPELHWELDYLLAEPRLDRSVPEHLRAYPVSAGRVVNPF